MSFQLRFDPQPVKMVALVENISDHLVPKEPKTIMDLSCSKKRRVNFNLTIDIKQEDAQCVPQGPNSLSDFSDGESLSDQPIPTTPGGKPQVLIYPKLNLK